MSLHLRQSASHCANDGDAMSGKVPERTGCCGQNNGEHWTGCPRGRPAESKDERKHDKRHRQRRQMHLRQIAADLDQLENRSPRSDLNPKHLAQNRDAHLKSYTCQESNEHRLREEIGDES